MTDELSIAHARYAGGHRDAYGSAGNDDLGPTFVGPRAYRSILLHCMYSTTNRTIPTSSSRGLDFDLQPYNHPSPYLSPI
jgi:hypothetical protein